MDRHVQRTDSGSESFSAVAGEWLDWKRTSLKASSVSRYADILDHYLLPRFGEQNITEISRSQAAAFTQALLASGGNSGAGLAPGSAALVLSVFKNILHFAGRIKGEIVPDLSGVSVRQPNRPLRVFTAGEQKRLAQFLLRRRDAASCGILLALYTGLRIGELCALRWEDVSLEEGCLHVRHTMQRLSVTGQEKKTAVVITAPKSPSSQRTIPLPGAVLGILRAQQAPGNCFVLTGSEDYIEPRSLENRFKAILRLCGIEATGFHTCRHSFATRCVELGFDVKSLSEILGHTSVNITMNRYVHPSLEYKRENMDRLSRLLEEEQA